jgi:3-hydroxymyristoyl/3-hydroxydecanoyl-(acyl carrier protein) dehydratase
MPRSVAVGGDGAGGEHHHAQQAGNAGRIGYFMSADAVKFRKPVVAGDTLFIEVELVQQNGTLRRRAAAVW